MGMVVPSEDNTPWHAKRLQRQIDTWRRRAQMASATGGEGNERSSKLEQEALRRAADYQKELDRVLGLNNS